MQALFLEHRTAAGGRRFAILHAPRAPARGSVLALYPFAEEMNKSRRMVGLGARALADAGFAVLAIDLLGCGDSTGDLAEARWDDWVDDALHAAAWLAGHHPGPQWFWGVRAGALVATAAARRLPQPPNFLFWQPQSSGRLVLQQFLRLKMANQLQQHGSAKGLTESLQAELAAGRPVDVAGYALGPGIAQGLAQATLAPIPGAAQLAWCEVTSREPAALAPAAESVLAAWRDAGAEVRTRAVTGPAFWQTLEIEDAPALVQATPELLLGPP